MHFFMWTEFLGLIIISIGVEFSNAEPMFFEMDASCPGVSEFQMDEYIKYNVVWKGTSIGEARYSNWCSVIFRGKNKKQWKQLYKVCAVVQTYNVVEDTFELRFFREYSAVPDLTFDSNYTMTSDVTFCGRENEFLRIEMETSNQHPIDSFVEIYVEALKVNSEMERASVTDKNCEEPSTSSGMVHVGYLVVTVVLLLIIGVIIVLCVVRHYRLRSFNINRQQREVTADLPSRQFSITYSRPQSDTARPTSATIPSNVSYTTVSQNEYTDFPMTGRSQEHV